MEKINLIIDTDMGPDCDDAGALGIAHILCKRQDANILAVTHCTSNPYGAGCIDAINIAFGKGDTPVGTLKKEGFLDNEEYRKYNKFIALNFPNKFGSKGFLAKPATQVMREVLEKAEDNSVVLVAIGPLTNIAMLLKEELDLVKRKVKLLVSMAGCFNETQPTLMSEWNVLMDVDAAKTTAELFPNEIVFAPFELGESIITGKSFGKMPSCHPVRKAYELHSPQGRSSWDLTAMWYALCGVKPFFELSPKGRVSINSEGHSVFTQDDDGNHRFLINKKDPKEIATALDHLWEAVE